MTFWLVALFLWIGGYAYGVTVPEWPNEIKPILSSSDAKGYSKLFMQARQGTLGNKGSVKDALLWPHVQAAYFLAPKSKPTYGALKDWLSANTEHPQAVDVYRLALDKRPMPKQVCKGKGKKKKCHTEGSAAPPPELPLVIKKREAAQEAAERRREQEYAGLGEQAARERRQYLGQSWRLRNAKKYDGAFNLLNDSAVRRRLGDDRWQTELTLLADIQQPKQNWRLMRKAAELATDAQGPNRDEALWWAGWGAYRLGDIRAAAKHWEMLSDEEPITGKHASRSAYWAARAFTKLGQEGKAQTFLRRAAKLAPNYYGILAAKQLGIPIEYSWQAPELSAEALQSLYRIPMAKAALALAQIGETSAAQWAFRSANEDIPSQATGALAALALKLHLPATALQMGKTLYQEGEIVPAALFPKPDWRPNGPQIVGQPLLLAIMRQESAFHPTIGSRVGAQGLMQLMPATARLTVKRTGRGQADRASLHDPINNMTLGHDYLMFLQGHLEGDLIGMIAGYNAGEGRVKQWKAREIAPLSDPIMFVESIPFDETRDYAQKVLANLWVYEERFGKKSWSLPLMARNKWPQRWTAEGPDERDIGG